MSAVPEKAVEAGAEALHAWYEAEAAQRTYAESRAARDEAWQRSWNRSSCVLAAAHDAGEVVWREEVEALLADRAEWQVQFARLAAEHDEAVRLLGRLTEALREIDDAQAEVERAQAAILLPEPQGSYSLPSRRKREADLRSARLWLKGARRRADIWKRRLSASLTASDEESG